MLVDAFTKGQNQGLVNALTKMPAVGRISITGTLGYDLSFIRQIPTPTGRTIRFVTNRQIRFGEAYADTQSQNFNLTAGEIDINTQDKNKSTGTLYPAAQLTLDKEGQLQLELKAKCLEAFRHYRLVGNTGRKLIRGNFRSGQLAGIGSQLARPTRSLFDTAV